MNNFNKNNFVDSDEAPKKAEAKEPIRLVRKSTVNRVGKFLTIFITLKYFLTLNPMLEPLKPEKTEKTKESKSEKAIMKRLGGYIKEPSKSVKPTWAKEQVSFLVLTLTLTDFYTNFES